MPENFAATDAAKAAPENPVRDALDLRLQAYGITSYKLAQGLEVNRSMLHHLRSGRVQLSTPMAVRLATYFGEPLALWLEIQVEQMKAQQVWALAQLRADLRYRRQLLTVKEQGDAMRAAATAPLVVTEQEVVTGSAETKDEAP